VPPELVLLVPSAVVAAVLAASLVVPPLAPAEVVADVAPPALFAVAAALVVATPPEVELAEPAIVDPSLDAAPVVIVELDAAVVDEALEP
jgi:hypothetical protein